MQTFKNTSARTAAGRLVLTAALAAMPILTACGGHSQPKGLAPQTIQVHLTEGAIQMPSSLPAGKTTFKVVNDGTAVHGFQIEGPAGGQVPSVAPGQTASLEIDLDPGTYRVLSPMDAPNDPRMVKAVSVTQS